MEDLKDQTIRKPAGRSREKKQRMAGKENDQLIRPYDGLLIAFFIPIVIMIIIFAQRGIFPFGEESFLRTDLYHQYAPFFSEFREKLTTGGSLLYSWDVGMGINFSALYAYYLASPLNWLLILCPKNLVIEFITYMIVLKIGLSGLTFAWYLKKHCRTNSIGIGFFGIFYAMSGYMAAYSWNIMWLDCILLFPIIMLGLERLVNDGKSLLYCVSLGLSILSNYYISIMICIFMVIYFIVLMIMKKKDGAESYIEAFIRFCIYSLLAGGLAGIVLIPEIYALQFTASGSVNFPTKLESYFSIFDMIARHIANVETEIGLEHWPNIYCGTAVLMFFPLYLSCKKISGKEKAVYSGMLLFFMASFSTNVLNFLWHGFHYPNSLPCRQSFIYIFLVLFVCFRAFMYLSEIPRKHVTLSLGGAVIFVLLAQKMTEQSYFHFVVFYVAILYLAAYAGLIILYQNGKRGVSIFLAMCLVSMEAAINMTATSVTTTSRTAYLADSEEVELLMDTINSDEAFYRVEKKTRKTKNDGAFLHFPSVSLFSSTASDDLSKFFRKMGCEASTNSYSITGSTPLVDSLLSVKYALFSEEVQNSDLQMYLQNSGGTYLYENLCTLPLGFMVSPDISELWGMDGSPAYIQNNIAMYAGADPVLVENAGSVAANTFSFIAEESGDYYAYVENKRIKKVDVDLPTGKKTFNHLNRGFFMELGTIGEGNEVYMSAEEAGEVLDVRVYRFDDDAMQDVYNSLSRVALHTTAVSDTEVKAVIDSEEGILMTTIPFDPGWTVVADGSQVETQKVLDAFLGIPLTGGHHEIVFRYYPPGLNYGILISLVSLAFLFLLAVLKKWDDKRRMKRMEKLKRDASSRVEMKETQKPDQKDPAGEKEEPLKTDK